MNNVLLISEKMIKENSLVSDNVDSKYIQNAIRTAQDIHLQPVIGSKLFKKLCDMIASREQLADLYQELLSDYVQPVLINAVMSDLVLQLTYKFRNMGTVQTADTNIIVPSLRDLEYIRNDYNLKTDFYINRLNDFIKKNCTKFGKDLCAECGDLPANKHAYKLNITL